MIAFLGGTFDPIHLGHVHAARTVRDVLACSEVRLVLSARPSHRGAPVASIEARWEMLALAIAGMPGLRADASEMSRPGPSFTIDTLSAARCEEGGDVGFAWVIGWDAYLLLPTWRGFRDLLDLAHFVVVRRPGQSGHPDRVMQEFTDRLGTKDPADLSRSASGRVLLLEAPMLSISASGIRARCGRGESVADLLPRTVSTYIEVHRPYGGPPA